MREVREGLPDEHAGDEGRRAVRDTIPEVADIFGIPRGAPFYAMLFGNPAVDYVRCVDRSSAAKIVYQ